MVFCGSCGKRASDEDKFCTNCGTTIKQATVKVVEEVGQVIKEEYRQSQAPPEAELSRGSHIGDQKRSGEWLETTVDNILKFAGFRTTRQAPVIINDKARDKFLIDILAVDPNLEIFVECKDYQDMKMDEKIMFTFIGQINHYRKHQSKRVIGILAMTARDNSNNIAIREKLRQEDSFLWDGSFIEHLQNKMIEYENKNDFRIYLLNHLDVMDIPESRHPDGTSNWIIRYAFYTVRPEQYIGKKFDVMNIIDDIKLKCKPPVKVVNHLIESIHSEDKKTLIRYLIRVDFSLTVTPNEIQELEKKGGFMRKLRRRSASQELYNYCVAGLRRLLEITYGVNYVKNSKSRFETIFYEGGRVI